MTPRDKLVNIRLTQPEHDAIAKAAAADHRPVAVFIRLAALQAAMFPLQKGENKKPSKSGGSEQ